MPLPVLPLIVMGVVVAAAASGAKKHKPRIPLKPLKRPIGDPSKLSDADRLEAVLTSWAALVDATHATWGVGLVQSQDAMAAGGLLWNVEDIFRLNYGAAGDYSFCKNWKSANTARLRWNNGEQHAIIAQAEALLKTAVDWAAWQEEASGRAITTTGGATVSLFDVAEQYATDAAVSYLTASIPGAGAVLGLASAIEDATGLVIGWTSGTGRQEVPRSEMIPGEIACRNIAVARVKDLIAHVHR